MNKFWQRVESCDHKNKTDHAGDGNCGASQFCSGTEERCADCLVYIYTCACGSGGMSGWSAARWATHWRNKQQWANVLKGKSNE